MKSRLYTIEDYESLKPWWGERWGEAPSVNALPLSGLIVEKEGEDIAAAWLYMDMTTPVAVIAFLLTNPNNSARTSHESLIYAINGLKELAKSQGRIHIITMCPTRGLSKIFKACGFATKDTNMEHLTITM